MADYFLKYNDRVSGPFPIDTLKAMAGDGLVTALHHVSADRENWLPAEQLPGLFEPAAPVAGQTPLPTASSDPTPTVPPITSPTPSPSAAAIPPATPAAPPASAAVPAPNLIPSANPSATVPPPLTNPIAGFVQGVMKGGRINLKVTFITCLVAVAMSLILGLTTLIIRGDMDRVNSQLDGDYYSWGNPYNVMGLLKLAEDYDSLNNSFTALGVVTLFQSLALLAYFVFWLVPLYRCWKTVEPLRAQDPTIPSPGKAVGFLLIPFFGIYWMFPCLSGLGKHLNAMERLRNPDSAPSGKALLHGLGIAVGVSSIVVGILTMAGNNSLQAMMILTLWLLLTFFYVKTAVDVANRIPLGK